MKKTSFLNGSRRQSPQPRKANRFAAFRLGREVFFALLFVFLAVGCQQRRDSAASDAFALPTAQLKIGNAPVEAEIADTPTSSERGLMYRSSMAENHGMLFVFDNPRKATFWMKNTKIPLSIAYIDKAGKILEIKSMKPFDETIVPSATDKVGYALEMNDGWFNRHGISAGQTVQGIPK
jgi:uncharacterized protein